MKILFIFTGGTIGSTLTGGVISTDEKKPYKIVSAYKEKFGIDFEYDTLEPYTELSENNTGAHLSMLTKCVKDNLKKGYDGIIVTHGTDTLQYTSAAIGYAIGSDTVPVCIVSANRPIDNEKSNGLDNLHGAVRFIECKGGKGAFTVYRNDEEDEIFVHRATRLLAGVAFSDFIGSIYRKHYGYFDREYNFIKNEKYKQADDETAPLDFSLLDDESKKIAVLPSYTGASYPHIPRRVRYIIINTYHSGTLNTKSSYARKFFIKMKRRKVSVFASGIGDGAEYASATEFSRLGIIGVKDISPVSLYIKLWALSSNKRDVKNEIALSLSGDVYVK